MQEEEAELVEGQVGMAQGVEADMVEAQLGALSVLQVSLVAVYLSAMQQVRPLQLEVITDTVIRH